MINEGFKPRTSEHLPQICQQTFGEPSVMSNETVLVLWLEKIPSKKNGRPLWCTMNHSYPNKLSEKNFEPYAFSTKNLSPNKNFHPRPGCFIHKIIGWIPTPCICIGFKGPTIRLLLQPFCFAPHGALEGRRRACQKLICPRTTWSRSGRMCQP